MFHIIILIFFFLYFFTLTIFIYFSLQFFLFIIQIIIHLLFYLYLVAIFYSSLFYNVLVVIKYKKKFHVKYNLIIFDKIRSLYLYPHDCISLRVCYTYSINFSIITNIFFDCYYNNLDCYFNIFNFDFKT